MTRSADWEGIIASSAKMLEMARESRWVEVAELHKERHDRLQRFFSDYNVTDMAAVIAEGIDEILRADHQLANLVESDRVRLTDEMSQSKASAHAMRAYAETP